MIPNTSSMQFITMRSFVHAHPKLISLCFSRRRPAILEVWNNRELNRVFSSPAAAAPETTTTAAPFHYPKAQALFEKITATISSIEDVRTIQREMYVILGRPLRQTEFYYDGLGSKRKKGGAGANAAPEAAPVAEVKTVWDVKLLGFDATAKIKVIKEIRAISGLGLKEAKDLVESAPCMLQKGMKSEAAEEMKAKLVEIGAQIELV